MKVLSHVVFITLLAAGVFGQPAGKSGADQPRKDAENQEARSADTYYKINILIYELEEGKRVNQRDYTMIAKTNTNPSPSTRINTRVPVYSEEKKITYIDAGLDLNCSLKDLSPGKVEAHCEFRISGFVRPEQLPESRNTGVSAPVLRSTVTNSWGVLTVGKPFLIASIDDINSARRMQFEVTATKID
ncbi:MAG TPA: hypothetical protein VFR84_06130 [Candidatus Angelobacter sp.]|nr:hypothetical protein [Candidatus Angelobacter sp.]